MIRYHLVSCLLSGFLLAGCASMSPEQCQYADWYGVGVSDGLVGRDLNRISEYREDCAKVGIVPDQAQWMAGRDEGLQKYCDARAVYERGTIASSFNPNVCHHPADLMQIYRQGYKVYERQKRIDEVKAHIAKLQQQRDKALVSQAFTSRREMELYLENIDLKIRLARKNLEELQSQGD